jgi:hypothetical protein
MIYAGVDCGISGAIAFLDSRDGSGKVFDLPRHADVHRLDGFALARLIREQIPASEDGCIFIEQIHAIGGSAMQKMGAMMKSVGIILGAVDCTRIPVHEVRPQAWKKLFALTSDKAECLEMARRLYPELQADLKRAKDHNRGEAVLIAHFGLVSMTGSYEATDESLEAMPF